MSRIKICFDELKANHGKALISYITAGDPHPNQTVEIMHTLVDAGTDIIELGVPFSDPMADGPVIQAACERALNQDTSLADVLKIVKDFRMKNNRTPVVFMGYQNPFEIYGVENFAQDANGLVDGVITVDLPPEESSDVSTVYYANDIDMIYLLAPTTREKRIQTISNLASGFLYYVSFKGITGASRLDVNSVESKLKEIRAITKIPIAVGFGIKDAETASMVADYADAVVVGSAIVSIIANHQNDLTSGLVKINSLLRNIKDALDNTESIQNTA
ncbi:MAG: tryptophan synthase subunit alpha [Pseudomonadota bacterium]